MNSTKNGGNIVLGFINYYQICPVFSHVLIEFMSIGQEYQRSHSSHWVTRGFNMSSLFHCFSYLKMWINISTNFHVGTTPVIGIQLHFWNRGYKSEIYYLKILYVLLFVILLHIFYISKIYNKLRYVHKWILFFGELVVKHLSHSCPYHPKKLFIINGSLVPQTRGTLLKSLKSLLRD